MNNTLNLLLRTAITATLEDREAFIEKFSSILTQITDMEPEKANKAGEKMSMGLQAFRDELQMENLWKGRSTDNRDEIQKTREKIEQLSKEIESIKAKLEENRSKAETNN